jgi:uncharacterized repeat protein (TIGR01451 family)
VATLGGTTTSSGSFIVGTNGTPDLAITAAHTGSFTQGDSGDTTTIIVTNLGTAASIGPVTVEDTLPAGLTATAISGDGWTTNLGTLTCTRSDALATGMAYPAITVTVNVSASAPASVTNTAIVSGGDDTNAANNTASDPTTINPAAAPTAGPGRRPRSKSRWRRSACRLRARWRPAALCASCGVRSSAPIVSAGGCIAVGRWP